MSEVISIPVSSVDPAPAAEIPALLIGIEKLAAAGQVTLRADLAAATDAVRLATGCDAPGMLRVTANGDARAVWMSHDELLLMVADAASACASLNQALADEHHMALDVSDTRTVLRLSGDLVGEVLAKGAPCDVTDAGFPPGTARRTHLAGLAVGLWRLEADVWEIVCFHSYAHHLITWLQTVSEPGSEVGWHS